MFDISEFILKDLEKDLGLVGLMMCQSHMFIIISKSTTQLKVRAPTQEGRIIHYMLHFHNF